MPSKELWLVPENHATVKLDWNCFSWNELTEKAELNCEIDNSWRTCWKSQVSFRHQSSPVSRNIAVVEKIRSENFLLRSTLKTIRFEFWTKGALVTVVGDSHISLTYCLRHLGAVIQLAVSCSELYFTRFIDLKRTGTFASKARLCVYFNWFEKSDVLMSIPDISLCNWDGDFFKTVVINWNRDKAKPILCLVWSRSTADFRRLLEYLFWVIF